MVTGDYGRVAKVFCETGFHCTAKEIDNTVVPGIVDAKVAISRETGRMVGFIFLHPERLSSSSVGLRILQIVTIDGGFPTFCFLIREAKVNARSRGIRIVHAHTEVNDTTVVMREWLRRNMFLPWDFKLSSELVGPVNYLTIWYYEDTDIHRGTCVLAGILDDSLDDSRDIQISGQVLCDF